MSDDMKRHTGRLLTTAVSLQQYQKRIDAMVNHAMGVVSILNEALKQHLPGQAGYGVDDNIEVDSTERRYGWRIYAARPGVGEFSGFSGKPPEVTERQTLLTVELIFNENDRPIGYLVDTRRKRTVYKTGLLGIKQKQEIVEGDARRVPLNDDALIAAINALIPTMPR